MFKKDELVLLCHNSISYKDIQKYNDKLLWYSENMIVSEERKMSKRVVVWESG